MITAKQALQALEDAGLLTSWAVTRVRRDGSFSSYTSVSGSGKVSISEETYGKRSFLYVRGNDKIALRQAQKVIRKAKGTVEPWNIAPMFSFRISTIKGWHHWE